MKEAGPRQPSDRASAGTDPRELTLDASHKGEQPAARRSRPHSRWWFAVLVAVLVSVPVGWLLSYAAPLLFLLGLFFYVLFGLIIGATAHRIAAPGRPYSRVPLLLGTAPVVLVCWIISVGKEVAEVPRDLARQVLQSTRNLRSRSVAEFESEAARQIRTFLKERFPPGGMIGAARWIIAGGELKAGDISLLQRTVRREQRGLSWAVRVILSVAMLVFGIGSQTYSLRLAVEPSARLMDEKKALPTP